MPVANKITMLLYQATLGVMLLMDHRLHVLGLRMEETPEYQSCLLNGCDNLQLQSRELTGTLPTELGHLTGLVTGLSGLNLTGNAITGAIPTELGQITSMTYMRLGYNDLTGSIPTQLALLTNLEQLRLFSSDLTGTIPTELALLTTLTGLDLSYNYLTGTLPTELGLLTQLNELYLESNDLHGAIPTEMGVLASSPSEFSLELFNNAGLCGELDNTNLQSLFINTAGTALGTVCASPPPPPSLRSAEEQEDAAPTSHAGVTVGLMVGALAAAVCALPVLAW